MWPGGAFGTRGRIPAELAAEPGRVLIHADAAEWEDERRADQRGLGTQEASAAMQEAAVRVLAAWSRTWRRRPSVVIAVPTRTGGDGPAVTRVEGVAQHLGEVGRLPVQVWDGVPPLVDGLSGAQQALAWREAFERHGWPAVTGESVLLVVDTSSTTWEPTVAAASLRQAGADVVLPLVIHRTLG